MSSEKRLLLCIILSAICFMGLQSLMTQLGLIQPPPAPPRPAAAKPDADLDARKLAQATADLPPPAAGELPANPFMPPGGPVAAEPLAAKAPAGGAPQLPKLARLDELVLGAANVEDGADPYKLRLQLAQLDASVARATSARFDAEFDPANRNRKPGRLVLIQDNPRAPDAPGSLAIFVSPVAKAGRPAVDGEADEIVPSGARVEMPISAWEVVREKDELPAVRAITKVDPATKAQIRGQELRFRAKLARPAVEVVKVFRIYEGEDGFEVQLRFAGPTADGKLTYRLIGPHGIPIEGEWYTSTFRDVFFGQAKRGATEVITRTAYDAVTYAGDSKQVITTDPIKFAGVEDQYFATFVEPLPTPKSQDERWDESADSFVIRGGKEDATKADVTVAIDSKPISVGPNLGEVVHTYRVFVGAKTAASLAPFEADELVSYRKNQYFFIPFASTLAKNVIAPLLERIYGVTASVSHFFGGKTGNYGIAIILLTMTVRLIMFPIGRKQAMMAKKMQDLQPVLAEVKEKYKDDKEALTRETMNVWKQNKINPAAGCVPALIQMPIFVGLWQSLNNSVELRHSSFLYIRDLAAPDMLFRFPIELPVVGHFFNLLPFLVVALMLVQTKLFSPPPTTPEAEMQQKTMKYLMVFMAFMFYKVPSGLGLYFITSSLWQIGERLLLPKLMKTPKAPAVEILAANGKPLNGGPGRGPANGNPPGGAQGWLGKRLEKLLEEASKDTTIRNAGRNGSAGGNGNGTGGTGKPGDSKPSAVEAARQAALRHRNAGLIFFEGRGEFVPALRRQGGGGR